MEIKFLGAVQEVTGSNYLVECAGKRFFVDCGIHQGYDEDAQNKAEAAVNPAEIDAVFLTHAHMDHSGRVPYLVKRGFKGKIWATRPAVELLEVLWRDSAHLMMEEATWKNRKNSRRGLPLVEPLYDLKDVEDALKLLSPIDYETLREALPGVELRCHNAGHILGSASLSLALREKGREALIVFSGDLGQAQAVIERAPTPVKRAQYVLIESTYGDRGHKDLDETRTEFRSVVTQSLLDGGKVFIPSFVIDRAQRLLYELLLMQQDRLIPEIPIFFDSPMGVKATELYRRYGDTLSDDVRDIIAAGKDPFAPRGLTYVSSPDESRQINDVPAGIVIAGSGMCSGGRIVHHLKHGLWNPKNHVIFVGYQGYGTLGRRLVDGASVLRIAGEEVSVAAQVHTIGGFSAHGDRDDLLLWAQNFETNPLFFVTHGERPSSHALAAALQQAGMRSMVPLKGQDFQLLSESVPADEPAPSPTATDGNAAVAALDALARLIEKLRPDIRDAADAEVLMPLLLSSRTLLETAGDKVRSSRR
ncbi:MAG: MBL fold metallo-hydrolase [Synergistaceae bacterium]|jgi:metallo-beta-lactamase family protein|nr:MBL fold metallo-hydrolase [Synergistaceae bacterium]